MFENAFRNTQFAYHSYVVTDGNSDQCHNPICFVAKASNLVGVELEGE